MNNRIKPRFLDAINEHLKTYGAMSVSECRAEAKKLVTDKTPRTTTFYDARMNASERRFILRAARLPFDGHYANRRFYEWSADARRRMINALPNFEGYIKQLKKIGIDSEVMQ